MSDVKITDLPTITNSAIVGADSFPIVDTVANATKRITMTELDKRYAPNGVAIPQYANQAALPTGQADGSMAETLDTHTLWIYNAGTTTWVAQLASPANLASQVTGTLPIGNGGTGGATAAAARASLAVAASGANTDLTSIGGLTTPLSVAQGGTGANGASAARTSLGAAASGANTDITSLGNLTTALSVAQGGTGSTTASGARGNLVAAASGANSDITSIAGLTTPLTVAQGGTGSATATGTGSVVLATSPTLVTPAIGTPSSGNLANCSGLPNSGTTATSVATASAIVARDTNANAAINNLNEAFATTATAAGTTTLTAASPPLQQFTGSTTQTVQLPSATTVPTGCQVYIFNRSSGALTIKDGGGSTIATLSAGNQACFTCAAVGTTAGSWDQTITYTGTLPVALGGTGTTTSTGTGSTVLSTSPTLTAPVQSSYEDFTQIATPAAPAAGKVRLYSKSGDGLYTLTPGGVETQLGAGGAGSGEKNYLQSGSSTVAGWTAVAGTSAATTQATVTLSTDSTAANIPRPYTTKTALKMVATAAVGGGAVSAFAWATFQLDPADYNKKLKVQFDQNTLGGYLSNDYSIEVRSSSSAFTAPTRTSGTLLALSTDSSAVTGIPALDGTFRTTFDAPGSATPYIAVFFVPKTTVASTLEISDLVVGPGVVTQGAALGPWQTSTMTIGGSGSAPTKNGSPVIDLFAWRREGDSIRMRYSYQQTSAGSAGSGTYLFPLPNGYTVNPAYMNTSGTNDVANFGAGNAYNGTNEYILTAAAYSSTNIYLQVMSSISATANLGSANVSLANASARISFEILVPVNELAGSGTVNVAQNDVEYASNSSTSDAADTTSFAYGPSGSPLPGALTATRLKTVRFQTPIQATDVILIQVRDKASGDWTFHNSCIHGTLNWVNQNTTNYGITLFPSTVATDVKVAFAQYATPTGATYGSAGEAWTSVTTADQDNYRLVKIKGGAAVGFGAVVPGTSAGLVPAAGLPGNTTGNAIATGTVGQILTNTASSSLAYTATNTTNFINLSLTPGVWMVTGSFGGYTPSSAAVFAVALNTTSASLGSPGLNYNEYLVGTTGAFVAPAPSYYVNVSATTNVYLVGFGSAGTTTAAGSAYMQAVRIA